MHVRKIIDPRAAGSPARLVRPLIIGRTDTIADTTLVAVEPEDDRVDWLARLQRGLNLNHCFTQNWRDRRSFIDAAITAEDLQRIKGWGFTHVRLPVDPEWLLDRTGSPAPNEEFLGLLDAKLDLILASGLEGIVEMNPLPERYRHPLPAAPAAMTVARRTP